MTLQTCAPENFRLCQWGDKRTHQASSDGERGTPSPCAEFFSPIVLQFQSYEVVNLGLGITFCGFIGDSTNQVLSELRTKTTEHTTNPFKCECYRAKCCKNPILYFVHIFQYILC